MAVPLSSTCRLEEEKVPLSTALFSLSPVLASTLLAVAAGNSNKNAKDTSPARAPTAVTVAAMTRVSLFPITVLSLISLLLANPSFRLGSTSSAFLSCVVHVSI